MAKRKLSKKQARNQAKIRADRIRRSKLAQEKIETQLSSGELGPEQPGLLVAHHGVHLIVEDEQGQFHQCKCRKNIDPLATGDKVIWRAFNDGTGVIVAMLPRKHVLARPSGRLVRPMAANVDLLVIVIAPAPMPSTTTIDRYLVISELLDLEPLIVINKTDLLDQDSHDDFLSLINIYEQLDYQQLRVSCKQNSDLDKLKNKLNSKSSVFVGQSGVGKSSLISALIPNVEIQIGKLSDNTLLGKHTTTCARLYHLPEGGELIDSPGIRSFGLWNLPEETLIKGFIDFQPFLGNCKFRNCKHKDEPGCALTEAAAQGKIHPQRLENYHELLLSHARMLNKKG